MAGFHRFHVRLFRDSFNTPWGFRLQGGKDLNQPLSVQRVFSNTPAEGELQRGDVIVSIGERNGDELTHKQAKDLIERGGGQINLVLTRPPPGRHDVRGQPSAAPSFRTPAPVAPRTNPPKPMPYQGGGGSAGHKPKKLNISRLGGGGPDFGSDYSKPYTVAPPQQASRPSYRPVGGQGGGQMLNRVQESLDNIIYSPRTPEGYQAPPSQYQPPPSQYQPPPSQYQPPAPPSFQPNMSMSGVAPMYESQPQQAGYRPTYEAVDSGQYDQEEPEDFVPVWERRRTFQDQRPTSFKSTRSTPVPKVPRPVAKHPDAPSFGTDYSQKGQGRNVMWAPQRAPPQPQMQPSKPVQSEPPVYPNQSETIAPWRETLKSTGVKPWDVDLDYPAQQPSPRSGAYQPMAAPPVNQYTPAPSAAAPPSAGPGYDYGDQGTGDGQGGPQVVHLQYNSPMGLYSQASVKETLDGQTKAQLAQQAQQAAAPMKDGERDWNASAVFRMIQQDERRPGQAPPQKRAPVPPPAAPKPAPAFQPQQYGSPAFEDELGVSDF